MNWPLITKKEKAWNFFQFTAKASDQEKEPAVPAPEVHTSFEESGTPGSITRIKMFENPALNVFSGQEAMVLGTVTVQVGPRPSFLELYKDSILFGRQTLASRTRLYFLVQSGPRMFLVPANDRHQVIERIPYSAPDGED